MRALVVAYGVALFKLISVIAGYYFFGFFGALFSLFVGGFFDRIRAYGSGGMNPLQNALRQAVFLETVFISMGKLAKADGQVSEGEIAHVEQFMQKLGVAAGHRMQAIALFKKGTDQAFYIEPTLKKFMAVCGHTKHLKLVLLVYLILMALADGYSIRLKKRYSPRSPLILAMTLGYDQAAFKQLIGMVLNQSRFAGGRPVLRTMPIKLWV